MPARDRRKESGKLSTYQRMRDFGRTPEPAGDPAGAPAPDGLPRFVVQRHRASRLHYDLRFEIDGVLASWAVPKGPTLDPKVRRGAFHVEDHPMEYIDFEGVIPSREYGGGDVIVWDTGTWEPHKAGDPPDPGRTVAAGELHGVFHGQKLRGKFVLVRTGRGDGKDWLLLHKRDEHAVDGWDPEDHPHSVLTGRTNDEVKADPDRLWRSDLPAAQASVPLRASAVREAGADELAALDAFGDRGGTWPVLGRELHVTGLDRVLFPARRDEEPVTKRELLAYAARVAPYALPHLARRSLRLHRYPGGPDGRVERPTALPARAPAWLPRTEDADGHVRLVADEPAALVWAAGWSALEWFAGPATLDEPDRPAYAAVDVVPHRGAGWDDVLVLTRLLRTALDHLGLAGRPVLDGTGGVQVRVPVATGPGTDAVTAWAAQLAASVAAVVPDLVGRDGVRLDPTARRSPVPYGPRAAAGAPVAVPLEWDELDDPGLAPDAYTIRTVLDLLAERGDPLQALVGSTQRLPSLG